VSPGVVGRKTIRPLAAVCRSGARSPYVPKKKKYILLKEMSSHASPIDGRIIGSTVWLFRAAEQPYPTRYGAFAGGGTGTYPSDVKPSVPRGYAGGYVMGVMAGGIRQGVMPWNRGYGI